MGAIKEEIIMKNKRGRSYKNCSNTVCPICGGKIKTKFDKGDANNRRHYPLVHVECAMCEAHSNVKEVKALPHETSSVAGLRIVEEILVVWEQRVLKQKIGTQ